MIALSYFRKQVMVFAGIVYFLMFLFALVFYFERLNSDSGYYFYHSVNSQWFHIEHHRFVLILAEWMPVLGSNLHLSLRTLAILYSLSHVLFPAMLTYFVLQKYRNKNAAILLTILQFAGLKFAVFTPQFELFYGLNLLVFMMAYLEFNDPDKVVWNVKTYSFYGLLLFLVLTSHPMAVYCFVACMAVHFFNARYKPILLKSFIFIIFYLIWKKLSASEYEQSKFINFTHAFNDQFMSHYLNFQFLKKGCLFLVQHYPDILILFIIGIIYQIRNKQYLKLVLNVIFLKGSIILIWLMFEPETLDRYIEQVYFPFVFIACLWLYKCVMDTPILLILLLVFAFRSFMIMDAASGYQKRVQQMAQFTKTAQQRTGTKFYVTKDEMGENLYEQGNWSYGFETLMYSAIHHKKMVTITRLEDLEYNDNLVHLRPDDFLFRPFDIVKANMLNKQYFKLTECEYLLLKTNN